MCQKTLSIFLLLLLSLSISFAEDKISDIDSSSFFSTLNNQDKEQLEKDATNVDDLNTFEEVDSSSDGVEATDVAIEKSEKMEELLKQQTNTQKLRETSKKAIIFTKLQGAKLIEKILNLSILNIQSTNTANKIQIEKNLLLTTE